MPKREPKFDLASEVNPGPNRMWVVTHRPTATKPVRIELKEWIIAKEDRRESTPTTFTRLIGRVDTVADRASLKDAAAELLTRVGNVDLYVGVYESKES